jgi:hypothetical protein
MLYDVYPATAVILYMLSFGAGVNPVIINAILIPPWIRADKSKLSS